MLGLNVHVSRFSLGRRHLKPTPVATGKPSSLLAIGSSFLNSPLDQATPTQKLAFLQANKREQEKSLGTEGTGTFFSPFFFLKNTPVGYEDGKVLTVHV